MTSHIRTFYLFLEDRICLLVCGCIITFTFFLFFVLFTGFLESIPNQKYKAAMEAGDGKDAVHFAAKLFHQSEKRYNKQLKRYGHASNTRLNEHYLYLCYAYELNGEFDIALEQ